MQVCNQRGQISIVGEDIVRTMGMSYTEQTGAITQKTLFYSDNRRVRLSFRINLGRETVKQERHEYINSDETDRMIQK